MLDMVRNIFDPGNSFYEFGRKLIYVLALNIIFIITSIPIITMGASMAAMNTVFLKIINERENIRRVGVLLGFFLYESSAYTCKVQLQVAVLM